MHQRLTVPCKLARNFRCLMARSPNGGTMKRLVLVGLAALALAVGTPSASNAQVRVWVNVGVGHRYGYGYGYREYRPRSYYRPSYHYVPTYDYVLAYHYRPYVRAYRPAVIYRRNYRGYRHW